MPTRHRRLLILYRVNTSFFKLSKMGLLWLLSNDFIAKASPWHTNRLVLGKHSHWKIG